MIIFFSEMIAKDIITTLGQHPKYIEQYPKSLKVLYTKEKNKVLNSRTHEYMHKSNRLMQMSFETFLKTTESNANSYTTLYKVVLFISQFKDNILFIRILNVT